MSHTDYLTLPTDAHFADESDRQTRCLALNCQGHVGEQGEDCPPEPVELTYYVVCDAKDDGRVVSIAGYEDPMGPAHASGWRAVLGPFDSEAEATAKLAVSGYANHGEMWHWPAEGLPMGEALAQIRASYADHIAEGGSVEPCIEGDAICVDGGKMNGAVLYGVPLFHDDTGHWSI